MVSSQLKWCLLVSGLLQCAIQDFLRVIDMDPTELNNVHACARFCCGNRQGWKMFPHTWRENVGPWWASCSIVWSTKCQRNLNYVFVDIFRLSDWNVRTLFQINFCKLNSSTTWTIIFGKCSFACSRANFQNSVRKHIASLKCPYTQKFFLLKHLSVFYGVLCRKIFWFG